MTLITTGITLNCLSTTGVMPWYGKAEKSKKVFFLFYLSLFSQGWSSGTGPDGCPVSLHSIPSPLIEQADRYSLQKGLKENTGRKALPSQIFNYPTVCCCFSILLSEQACLLKKKKKKKKKRKPFEPQEETLCTRKSKRTWRKEKSRQRGKNIKDMQMCVSRATGINHCGCCLFLSVVSLQWE